MRRAVVTGGAGFIGSALVRLLGTRGYAIRVYDDLSTGDARLLEGTNVELLEGDVRDVGALEQAIRGCETVFHLAASTGVIQSLEDPLVDFDVNARGTLCALIATHRAGASRFVFSSSNAPLGANAYPASEEQPTQPLSPYGAGKAAGEAYCSAFHGAYGLDTVTLRFSNAYGPRSAHKGSVIPNFIRQILEGEDLVVYGEGSQTRDFVYVDDLAEGLIQAAESERVGGETFQLASGVETSINELIALLSEIVQMEPTVRREPARQGEILRNYSQIDKARSSLAYDPQVSLADGVRRTFEWFSEPHISPGA